MATKNAPTLAETKVFAEVEKTRLRTNLGKTGIIAAAIPLSLLALYPAAKVLAGHTTIVNVAVSLALSVTLVLTGAGLGAWVRYERQRANRAEDRVRDLEARLLSKDSALEQKRKRIEELERDTSGLRSDLKKLRGR
ncbi:MAG: hypothetical protein ACXVXZ_13065 [Mycobacteriaceae bacterium]